MLVSTKVSGLLGPLDSHSGDRQAAGSGIPLVSMDSNRRLTDDLGVDADC